jgi:hypothetical protein
MHSSTSSFERTVPLQPWRAIGTLSLLLLLAFTVGWEGYWRAQGYQPTVNDSEGLWSLQRQRVKQDSVLIIGDSRTRFDIDLDAWVQSGGGKRPILLGINGSSVRPVLSSLANDPSFAGTVYCNVTEGLFYAPGGPPLQRAQDRLKYYRDRTLSQRASDHISLWLEHRIAFLNHCRHNWVWVTVRTARGCCPAWNRTQSFRIM